MLKLKNVTKDYITGELVVNALRGVDIKFRKSEFVAILGPSGCGKTTLLNIMGGLDQYTTGDLEINGVSTVDYKDRDWDNYRNNSVGFVFQSYNLIMHQSVLANVELALTLSGVKKAERRQRAKDALIKVGLEKEINKMPNQLSGGQMQRVAIARAIVNDPHIILADEPTGALDTETSVQVMEILKEISQDRLVVMVTHNPDLADKYANRIISMSDGLILNDTNPIGVLEEQRITLEEDEQLAIELDEKKEELKSGKKVNKTNKKKAKMSIWTAFSLSLKNLFTKKARTILVSVAGSIGIIGIALILSVSAGFQSYIDTVESSTLSSQAVALRTQNLDYMGTLTSLMSGGGSGDKTKRPTNAEIYPNPVTEDLVSKVSNVFSSTDLTGFNYYMQNNLDSDKLHGFRYNYGVNPIRFYGQNNIIRDYDLDYPLGTEDYKLLYPYDNSRLNKPNWPLAFSGIDAISTIVSMFGNFNPFSTPLLKYDKNGKLQDNWDLVVDQYDVIATYNGYDINNGLNEKQMVLVVDEYNQIPDSVLFSLGLRGEDALLYSMLAGFAENGGLDAMLDFVMEETFEKGHAILGLDEQKFNYFKGKYEEIKARKGSLKWSQYFTGSEQGEIDKSIMVEGCIYLFFGYNYNKARNEKPITFDEIFALNARGNNKSGYKIIANVDEFYQDNGVVKQYEEYQVNNQILNSGNNQVVTDVEIVGILRLKSGATYGSLSTGLVYSNKLLEKLIVRTDNSALVQEVNQYSDDAFKEGGVMFNKYKEAFGTKKTENNSTSYTLTKSQVINGLNAVTYRDLLDKNDNVVVSDRRVVTEISLYASSFENKDYLVKFIKDFNNKVEDENSGVYGEKVEYSDLMGDLFKSVDIILNAITYVLVAFVGISLIVSSIMIGIITYISVLERTKEIGVLRSIGASKKDVGRVFNAETVIIGAVSGVFGVIFSSLLTIPIRLILKHLTGIVIPVALPFIGAVILVLVSVVLTLISGLIPSRMASKKDPVVALRSE